MNAERSTLGTARAARAALRAERLGRLRATALSTFVQAQPPKGVPGDQPVVVTNCEALSEGALADMAWPLAPLASKPPRATESAAPITEIRAYDVSKADAELVAQAPSHAPATDAKLETIVPWPWPAIQEATAAEEKAGLDRTPRSGAASPALVAPLPAVPAVPRYRLDAAEQRGAPPPAALPSFSLAGAPKAERPIKSAPYPVNELYRELRQSVLGLLTTGQPAALAWISPTGTEEAAPHLLELALALAETANGEVLLVDANFHSGALSRHLSLAEKPGLCEVLAKKLHAQAAGQETAMAGVRILPRGQAIALGPRRGDEAEWRSLLGSLKTRYQYVIVDAPSIEQPHCLPLAKAADLTFLVVALDYTPRETIHEAVEVLELQKVQVAGCVLTDAPQ